MSEIVERLRERPHRLAAETQEEAIERRQREREEAADTITRLEAEVERLRAREKDLTLEGLALIGRVERLREALEPFAEFGETMMPQSEKDDSPWALAQDETPVNHITGYGFTFGTFRAANRAYKAAPTQEPKT